MTENMANTPTILTTAPRLVLLLGAIRPAVYANDAVFYTCAALIIAATIAFCLTAIPSRKAGRKLLTHIQGTRRDNIYDVFIGAAGVMVGMGTMCYADATVFGLFTIFSIARLWFDKKQDYQQQ